MTFTPETGRPLVIAIWPHPFPNKIYIWNWLAHRTLALPQDIYIWNWLVSNTLARPQDICTWNWLVNKILSRTRDNYMWNWLVHKTLSRPQNINIRKLLVNKGCQRGHRSVHKAYISEMALFNRDNIHIRNFLACHTFSCGTGSSIIPLYLELSHPQGNNNRNCHVHWNSSSEICPF